MVKVTSLDARAAKEIVRVYGTLGIASMVEVKPDDSFNFECQRCGSCCSYPPGVNPSEMSRMSSCLDIDNNAFFKRYLTIHPDNDYRWKVKLRKVGEKCIFFDRDRENSCSIYEVAPRQCSARPVMGQTGNPFDLDRFGLKINPCEGLDKGPEYTVREWVEKKRLSEAWQEEMRYQISSASARSKSPKEFRRFFLSRK